MSTNHLHLVPRHPFTTAWAREHGIPKRALKSLVAEGHLRRPLRGVYACTTLEDTPDLRAACAALVLPAHAVVADRSAAWLHGIDLYGREELRAGPVLEVVSVGGGERTRRDGVLGGERALCADDIMTIGDVRVTTPLRTACDIACLRGRHRAIAALDAFRRAFGLTIGDLIGMLPRYAGRRGVKQLRELIPLSTARAESQPESWLRIDVHDEGFPAPEPNAWLDIPGWGRVRGDLVWEAEMTVLEYDGEDNHTSDEDKDHDKARRGAMRRAGWTVIVVTKDGFSGPGREAWVRELRAALGRDRSPGSRRPPKRVYARGPQDPSYLRRSRARR